MGKETKVSQRNRTWHGKGAYSQPLVSDEGLFGTLFLRLSLAHRLWGICDAGEGLGCFLSVRSARALASAAGPKALRA